MVLLSQKLPGKDVYKRQIVRGVDISRFDSVIISTPLSDEFGLDLVADIAKDAKNGVVVLAKHEIADEVQKKIRFTGAFVLPRPFNKAMLIQTIKLAEVAHIGMAKLEEENRQLSQQLSDMKIVNRAKSMLMQYLNCLLYTSGCLKLNAQRL